MFFLKRGECMERTDGEMGVKQNLDLKSIGNI